MKKKKAFLISPVRGHDPKEYDDLIVELEKTYRLYIPIRDTDQNDSIGLRICMDNKKAIKEADVILFLWDGKSQGCLFDLGMAFALDKCVVPVQLPPKTEGKSFQNMVVAYAEHQHNYKVHDGGELMGVFAMCEKCGHIR